MDDTNYDDWIILWRIDNDAYGNCERATQEIVKAFPELKAVKGHVSTSWGKRAHHWAVAPDDTVVDPTASQFPEVYGYEVWNPGDEVRAGSCMNCGREIWVSVQTLDQPPPQETFCGNDCEASFARSLGESL